LLESAVEKMGEMERKEIIMVRERQG